MDISAVSMALKQINPSQEVGLRVFSMAKDQVVQQGQDLTRMLQQSVQPGLGGNLDIKI